MSHSLQSAECQTVSRVLPLRQSNASVEEALPHEFGAPSPVHIHKQDAQVAAPAASQQKVAQSKAPKAETLPVHIGIFGRGKLASAVLAAAEGNTSLTVEWALGRGYSPRCPVDVSLDASRADAVREHVEWAIRTGTDLVIGTSGWEIPDLATMIAGRIGVLVAPNFSLGAALLRRFSLALGRFAATYPEADLGVCEKHHRAKQDAPSGTAKALAAALTEGCPRYKGWGMGPVAPGILSVSSLRTGYDVGYHEVLLDAPSETITLTHQARTRELFARGALEAMRWIRGRKGLYSFDDMAAELIDPLFRFDHEPEETTR
jgi:4-hydroxy-tetrahydrodipicolinate reductase